MVPGIALAAFATLGLGLVLGPEAPLIAIGTGVAIYTVKLVRRNAQPQLLLIMGAAGSFAAISVIFGSPIVAAVLVIEASGLGGAMLPLILVPGLIAAGVGSLVFIGMANWTGLNTSAYSLGVLPLPHFSHVTWEQIGWTIALGLAGALITQVIRRIGLAGAGFFPTKPFVLIPLAGVVVAALAILFEETTTHGANQVLFSGQEALPGLVNSAGTWSLGALAMVMLCKGLAWAVCLGSFRGGPTFPAIYIGAAGGIAASHLPGMPLTPAVAVGMGIMVAAFLKLPLSAVIIATALTASGGLAVDPLIIVGVVVAYLATLGLEGRLGAKAAAAGAVTGS
jgi:H+/Cl- antiporter ClcA